MTLKSALMIIRSFANITRNVNNNVVVTFINIYLPGIFSRTEFRDFYESFQSRSLCVYCKIFKITELQIYFLIRVIGGMMIRIRLNLHSERSLTYLFLGGYIILFQFLQTN